MQGFCRPSPASPPALNHLHDDKPPPLPAGTELDTGIQPEDLLGLIDYWDAVRGLYLPFESNLLSCSSDVYNHEMPGGQYTNLKYQVCVCGRGGGGAAKLPGSQYPNLKFQVGASWGRHGGVAASLLEGRWQTAPCCCCCCLVPAGC